MYQINLNSNQDIPDVSICVCTYKRPALLLKLLESLSIQTFPINRFEVVIVDNDISESAKRIVNEAMHLYPELEVRYEIEPIQGISFARNRTVSLARGKLLAFIDDDEIAQVSWLHNLVVTMETHQADAVLGPVVPKFPNGTSEWVVKSKYFVRPRFATGTFIRSELCRTGNTLIIGSKIKFRKPSSFDNFYAQSGGEDYDFFKWLEDHGGKFVWCDEAEVLEEVPSVRQTIGYMLDRGLRVSTTYWQKINQKRGKSRAGIEALFGVCIGISFAILGLLLIPFGFHHSVRSWVISVKGFGRLLALTNYKCVGYP